MIRRPRQLRAALIAATALAAVVCAAPRASAQYAKPEVGSLDKPLELYEPNEVGVDEQLGNYVPTSAALIDEEGKTVTLGSFLAANRPAILWLGYYECPMLCDQMSAGMVEAVKNVKLDAGTEFAIVQLSIDPNESAGLAKAKKASYLKELGQPGAAAGWNLLVASPESIKAVAGSVGYKYKRVTVEGTLQYAHPAVLMVLAPDGKVARYLYPSGNGSIAFDARTLQLSLIEASNGQVGSTIDRILLTCLRYDAHTGKYTWIAVNLMKAAGVATVVIMAAIFLPIWWRSARNGGDHPGIRPSRPAAGGTPNAAAH